MKESLPNTGGRESRQSLIRRFFAAACAVLGGVLLSCFILGPQPASAQSLGDLAREQRARVERDASSAPHVYTNEDLTAEKILAPADQERLSDEASSEVRSATPVAAPASVNPSSLGAATGAAVLPPVAPPVWPAGTPLGDVARYYRQRKQKRSVPTDLKMAQAGKERSEPARRSSFRAAPPLQPAQRPKRILASTTPREPAPDSPVIAVTAGDSLWKIASRYLGDGNQWREIASANPQIINPSRIHPGERILLPAATATAAAHESPRVPAVRVQIGDSLWKLAKAQWGTGQAWSCIAASNPQIEPSGRIFPGEFLTLPANCSSST